MSSPNDPLENPYSPPSASLVASDAAPPQDFWQPERAMMAGILLSFGLSGTLAMIVVLLLGLDESAAKPVILLSMMSSLSVPWVFGRLAVSRRDHLAALPQASPETPSSAP